MVSHDRTFLNNVVTSTIVFEETGVREYAGGYDEWFEAVARRQTVPQETSQRSSAKNKTEKVKADPPESRKLSYNEKRELDQLPGNIESMETKIALMHELMADPDYYQKSGDQIASDAAELKRLEDSLAEAYARWESLES